MTSLSNKGLNPGHLRMINLINVEGENEKLDQPNPENGLFLSTEESESGKRR